MNTKRMRKINFGSPVLDQREIEAVTKVLQGTTLTHGPLVAEFEKKFCETCFKNVILTGNAKKN